jgi:hypothetical protein
MPLCHYIAKIGLGTYGMNVAKVNFCFGVGVGTCGEF